MFTILCVIIGILFLLDFFIKRSPGYLAICKGNMPKSLPIIGTTGFLFKSDVECFQFPRKCAKEFNGGYGICNLGMAAYQTFKVSEVELLLSNAKHVNKNMTYDFLRPFMGDGLLCSGGDKWHQRRKILTPTFHFKILETFLTTFKEQSEELVKNVQDNHLQELHGTALQAVIPKFTLNTICETAMGVKLGNLYNNGDEYRDKIHEIGKKLLKRSVSPWLYPDILYTLSGEEKILTNLTSVTQDFTRSVIKKRRKSFESNQIVPKSSSENCYESTKRRYAMLDTLLAAEKLNLINEEGIREEVDTFMFEGFDTTSVALTFSMFMLAHHQHIQAQVFKEISDVLAFKDIKDLTMSDFSEFQLLQRVIKETIRLYPPVPFLGRGLGEEMSINGLTLPKDFEVYIHIYDLHRDPELYDDPERFDPDRFLPENCDKRHPYAYIPFSAGIRNCIGQKFALLEIKTVLVNVLKHYRLEAVTKVEELVFIPDIVLRSKDPVRIKFVPRNI